MSDILSVLTGNQVNAPRDVIEQGFIGSSQHTAGCFIKTAEVHSICNGTVIAIDRDPHNNTWSITVEVTSQKWVRYCDMASYKVGIGQKVGVKDLLGYSYRGIMRFEYCNSVTSIFPVRLLNLQLYKHDPTPIIFGQEILTEVS